MFHIACVDLEQWRSADFFIGMATCKKNSDLVWPNALLAIPILFLVWPNIEVQKSRNNSYAT